MTSASCFAPGLTALITGGASGIGFATAKLCVQKGMNVVLADRNEEALNASKQKLANDSSKVITVVVDVSKEEDWGRLKSTAVEAFGAVNLLMLNAGMQKKGTWGDASYFREVCASASTALR